MRSFQFSFESLSVVQGFTLDVESEDVDDVPPNQHIDDTQFLGVIAPDKTRDDATVHHYVFDGERCDSRTIMCGDSQLALNTWHASAASCDVIPSQ